MKKANLIGYGLVLLAVSIVAGAIVMEAAPSITGFAVGIEEANVTYIILNSTFGQNRTIENLTVHYALDDSNAKAIINWFRDNKSLTVVNMPFEAGSNATYTRDYSPPEGTVLVNGSTWSSTGGYDGMGAYQFDGAGDSIEYSKEELETIKDGVAITAWVKSNAEGYIVVKNDYQSQLFFSDDFTDSDWTNITEHSPIIGESWEMGYSKNASGRIYGNALTHEDFPNENGDAGFIAITNATLPSANYNVSVRVASHDSFDDTISIYARWIDSNNYYQLRFSSTPTAVYGRMYRMKNGVCTQLDAQEDMFAGVGDEVTLEVVGSSLKGYVNGVRKTLAIDTSLTSAGKAGVGIGASPCEPGDDANNQSVDSFRVNMLAQNFIPFMLSTVSGGEFSIMHNNVIYNATSSTDINDGAWHHIAATYDTREMRIYIDGSLKSTSTELQTQLPSVSQTIRIGRNYSNSTTGFFDGTIDELMIFNKSISSEQVRELYMNRTNFTVWKETEAGEVWMACITPNDGNEDGDTNCSNNITIRPRPPLIIINSTSGKNLTTENITAYLNLIDSNSKGILNWYLHDSSITVLNMPFEHGSTRGWIVDNGTTPDYSSYGNNGTVVNLTWNANAGYDGKGAYEFEGANGYIEIGYNESLNFTDEMTIEAWINSTSEGFIVAKEKTIIPGSMQTFFFDTFTESSSRYLTFHTPDIGSGWTEGYTKGDDHGYIFATSDELDHSGGSISDGYIAVTSTDVPSDDYNVTIKIAYIATLDDTHTIVARWLDSNNFYGIRVSYSPSYAKLYKRVGGTCTVLDDTDWAYDGGQNVTLEVKGNSIKVYSGNVLKASVTDSSLTAAGKAGTGMGATPCYLFDDSVNQEIDNFKVVYTPLTYVTPFALSTVSGGEFIIGNETDIYNATSSIDLNDNQWHHIAATYNGSEMRLYVDGSLESSSTNYSGDLPSSSNKIWIGRNYSGAGEYFNGGIDDVRMYKGVLSAEQINAQYHNRTDIIVPNETTFRNVWKACVTPNNASGDNTANCSNELTIIGQYPFTIDSVYAPSPQGYGANTIRATITDADGYEDIHMVWAEITAPGGAKTNYSMSYSGSDIWDFDGNIFTNGTHQYTVYANESSGLTKSSSSGEITIINSLDMGIRTDKDSYFNTIDYNTLEYLTTDEVNMIDYSQLENVSFTIAVVFNYTGDAYNFSVSDIVWVVDASGSMWDEQENIAANANLFAQALEDKGVNFRFGVAGYLGIGDRWGGHPYSSTSHSWPIATSGSPSTPLAGTGQWTVNSSTFGSMVVAVPENGWIENGLAALNETLSHYTFRPGASKFFVLVTDEDDDLYEGDIESRGDDYLNSIIGRLNSYNATVFAVTPPYESRFSEYIGPYGVAEQTGGSSYSIYSSFSSIITDLAERITSQSTLNAERRNATYTFGLWTNQTDKTIREIVESDPNFPGDFYTNDDFAVAEYRIVIVEAKDISGNDYSELVDAKFAYSADGEPISEDDIGNVEDSRVFIMIPIFTKVSYIRNKIDVNTSGYLELKVQRWNGAEYVDNETISNTFVTVQPDNFTWLHEIWNSNNFSTENKTPGDYRAYAALTDGNGNALIDSNGTALNATYNFTINEVKYTSEFCGLNISEDHNLSGSMAFQNGSIEGACINITADNLVLDCKGYYMIGLDGTADQTGIFLANRSNVTLKNCNVIDFDTGIEVFNSQGINLTNNSMEGSYYNLYVDADNYNYSLFDHYIDTSNTVDSKLVYYTKRTPSVNYDESSNAGTIYCIECGDVTVEDVELSNNGFGLAVYSADSATVINSRFNESYMGMYFHNTTFSVDNATITYGEIGIGAEGPAVSNFSIISSNISYNGFGMVLTGDTIDYNEIINNTIDSNTYEGVEFTADNFSHNNITNNTITGNGLIGMYVVSDGFIGYNEISSNYISNNTGTGIYIETDGSLWENRIMHNDISGNKDGGLFIEEAGFNSGEMVYNTISYNNFNDNPSYYLSADETAGLYVQLADVSFNNITDNNMTGNGGAGLYFWVTGTDYSFSANIISGNNMSKNGYAGLMGICAPEGLWDECSYFNRFENNILSNNSYFGMYIGDYHYSNTTNNTIEGNGKYGLAVYYYVEGGEISNNRIINNGWDGIYLRNDDDNYPSLGGPSIFTEINNNTIANNGFNGIYSGMLGTMEVEIYNNNISGNHEDGIYMYYSDTDMIYDNVIDGNCYGVYLSEAYDTVVNNNSITGSSIGLYSDWYLDTCEIANNTITSRNGVGITIFSSDDTKIYNNYLDNFENAYDEGNNFWNTSYDCAAGPNIAGGACMGGNFWSDYEGIDDGSDARPLGDGIGDTYLPHNSSAGIENGGDYHPITTTTSFPIWDSTDALGGGLTKYTGDSVTFWAEFQQNLQNIGNATCNISFEDGAKAEMTRAVEQVDTTNWTINSYSIPNVAYAAMDIHPDGSASVIFANESHIIHMYRNAGTGAWTNRTVNSFDPADYWLATSMSMEVVADNDIHLVYVLYDLPSVPDSHEMRYAHFDGGSWTDSLVDTSYLTGYVASFGLYTPSINAYDTVPAIAVCNGRDELYLYNYTGTWDNEFITDYCSISDHSIELVFNSSGTPMIAYEYVKDDSVGYYHSLKLAKINSSGDWEVESATPDGLNHDIIGISMVLDSDENPHISWKEERDEICTALVYAHKGSGVWNVSYICSPGFDDTAIDTTSSDEANIIHGDSVAYGDIKLTRQDSSGWDSETIERIGRPTINSVSLAIDSTGLLHAVYLNESDGLRYAIGNSTYINEAYFTYSRTFSATGELGWNVTCNRTGYATSTSTDTVFITSESAEVEIWDETDAKGGGLTRYDDEQVMFWANYTDNGRTIENATCNISFGDGSTAIMSQDVTVTGATEWNTSTVADPTYVDLVLDSSDRPHVVYDNGYNLTYSYLNSSGSWVNATVGILDADTSMNGISLALASDSTPHIAFIADNDSNMFRYLKHAYYNGSEWNITTIDLSDSHNMMSPSIALYNDRPSIAMIKEDMGGGSTIYFYNYSGGAWDDEIIDEYHISDDNILDLEYNSSGTPMLAYGSYSSGMDDYYAMYYAVREEGSWSRTRITDESASYDFFGVDMALDSDEMPHISYGFDDDSGIMLMHSYRANPWVEETLKTTNVEDTAIAISPEGRVHVAYLNETSDGYIRHAYNTGSGWTDEDIELIGSPMIGSVAMDVDSDGYLHLAYVNGSGKIRYSLRTTETRDALYYYSYAFDSSGEHSWDVTCNRTGYETSTDSDTISIGENYPPVMEEIIINSTSGYSLPSDNLTCWARATDSEGDILTYAGFWYLNGTQNASFNTSPTSYTPGILTNVSTLDSSETSAGEKWSCEATAHDSDPSSALMSSNLTINAKPSAIDASATIESLTDSAEVEQNMLFNVTASVGCSGVTNCENIIAILDPAGISEADYTQRTCSEIWGFDCGDQPDGDNTFDDCSSEGSSPDEFVQEVYLNATTVNPGDSLNVTCELATLYSSDYAYAWYYNGTGWRQVGGEWTGSWEDDPVNRSANFTVDDYEGTHWVRCGIVYNTQDTDECIDASSSYHDNDDVNFTVEEYIPPEIGLEINSIGFSPEKIGLGTRNITCHANVTHNLTNITGVYFNITFPNSTTIELGNGTVNGDIWNSSSFSTNSMGTHNCSVYVLDNMDNSRNASETFYVGEKGVVPMDSGTPFYTIDNNPRYPSDLSCLESLAPGEYCTVSWEVNATGEVGQTWEFFITFNGSTVQTNKINVTILYGTDLEIWDTADLGGGAEIIYPDNNITFWANFTNRTNDVLENATCTAVFHDYSAEMSFNATSGLHYYTRTYSTAGDYLWDAVCNKTLYINGTATNSITIFSVPTAPAPSGGGGGGAPPEPPAPPAPSLPPPAPPTPAPSPAPEPEAPAPAPSPVVGCVDMLERTSATSLATREVPIGQIEVPAGYSIVKEPFRIDCRGDSFFMTLDIPSNYKDVRALRCRGGTCLMEVETTTTTTFDCGEAIEEEVVEEARFMPVEQMEVIISEEKSITEIDRTVETGKNRIEFTSPLPPMLLASIQSPTRQVREPDNPDLNIIGTPIVAKITAESRNFGAIITLPYAKEGVEEESAQIYVAQEEGWVVLGGTINTEEQTISAKIDNIAQYLNENGEAVFAVMAVRCEFCETSELEKVYHYRGSRDAIILIHGLGSSPETFQNMIDEFEFNEQPWQIWTYGYSSSRDIDVVAEELRNFLEAHSLEFDNIYIVAHSLGGLITQTALHEADLNRAGYTFVGKVRKAILLGVPNEGSPGAEVIRNLYKYLVNFKDRGGLFNVNSKTIDELITGRIVPRVPGVDYYVIAGTQPYEFNLGLFKVTSGTLEFTEPNDGIVTVTSAQHIGEDYINNMCEDYWEIRVTHTEMLDVTPSVRVVQKILSDSIVEQYAGRNLVGYNNYFKLRVDECSAQDTYLLIGQEIRHEEAEDLLCGCGNGFCGEGEDALSCPADCASIVTMENALLSGPIIIYMLTILTYLFTIRYTFRKHMHKKKGGKFLPYFFFLLTAGATALYRSSFGVDLVLVYVTLPLALVYIVSMDRVLPHIRHVPAPPKPAAPPKPMPTPEQIAETKRLLAQKEEIERRIETEKQRITLKRRLGPRKSPIYETAKSIWGKTAEQRELDRIKKRASEVKERIRKDNEILARKRKRMQPPARKIITKPVRERAVWSIKPKIEETRMAAQKRELALEKQKIQRRIANEKERISFMEKVRAKKQAVKDAIQKRIRGKMTATKVRNLKSEVDRLEESIRRIEDLKKTRKRK